MKRPVQPYDTTPPKVNPIIGDTAGHYIVSTVLLSIAATFLLTVILVISLKFWVALAAMLLIAVTIPPILVFGNAMMREGAKVQVEPLPHYWQSLFRA